MESVPDIGGALDNVVDALQQWMQSLALVVLDIVAVGDLGGGRHRDCGRDLVPHYWDDNV